MLTGTANPNSLEGKSLRESSTGKSKLAAMAHKVNTKAGREWLPGSRARPEQASISNLHFHASVGAVGHNSVGSVTIHQQWVAAAPEPDWTAVSGAFKEAVAVKAKCASSSEGYLTIAILAKAQEELPGIAGIAKPLKHQRSAIADIGLPHS